MIRYITVPKDKIAEAALDLDEAKPDQLLELQLDENEFIHLWKIGLFGVINSLTGSNIDQFESETINDKAIIQNLLDSKVLDSSEFLENPIVPSIKELFVEAVKRNTSIHFYF